MENSPANNARNFHGQSQPKTAVTTDNVVDFFQALALKFSVKDVQRDTGLSKKQVENIRQGLSGLSGTTLTRWIMNNPIAAGAYAEYVGLVRPGEARTAEALTRLVNTVLQKDRGGE